MAKHIGNTEIGARAAEEVRRVFKSYASAAKALGGTKKLVFDWEKGHTPGGLMLARLHYHGCDVLYILTGKRYQ